MDEFQNRATAWDRLKRLAISPGGLDLCQGMPLAVNL